MRTLALIWLAGATPCAASDLYAVGLSGDYEDRFYYRVSTEDASVRLVTHFEGQEPLVELERGPDGKYYGVGVWGDFERCDPINGQDDELFNLGDQLPTGGLEITPSGIAYVAGYRALPGSSLQRFDVNVEDYLSPLHLPDDFLVLALHLRDDGVMLASAHDEVGILYEIDLVTGAISEAGSFDEPVGEILSFGTDLATGQVYMLSGDVGDSAALYAVDIHAFEAAFIGDLPNELSIVGIAPFVCSADFNGDGILNILDFVAFQLAFQAGDMAADVNGDGVLDVLDFIALQAEFIEGC